MPKLIGPCFSLDASKTLGKALEFRRSRGVNILSQKHKPGSFAPFIIGYYGYQSRIYTSEAVRHWHLLSPAEKEDWEDYIK